MKLNIVLQNLREFPDYLDYLYAYRQHVNAHNQYQSDIEWVVTKEAVPGANNVLISYNSQIPVSDHFQLVLFDNQSEPISQVLTPAELKYVDDPRVYYVANSVVHANYPHANKIIPFKKCMQYMRDFFLRPFYPQYYDERSTNVQGIAFLNGQNRANRQYIKSLIEEKCPQIPVNNSKLFDGQPVFKLNDASIESAEDQQFRDTVNNMYDCKPSCYAEAIVVSLGNQKKFGSNFIIHHMHDAIKNKKVLIFPETTWCNDEISVNEKIIKCFLYYTIPFPIAGRNTNKLYNKLGFYTAWNLLPNDLKVFDTIGNHVERLDHMVIAIDWLSKNINNIDTKDYALKNYQNFLSNNFSQLSTRQLDQILVEKFGQY